MLYGMILGEGSTGVNLHPHDINLTDYINAGATAFFTLLAAVIGLYIATKVIFAGLNLLTRWGFRRS